MAAGNKNWIQNPSLWVKQIPPSLMIVIGWPQDLEKHENHFLLMNKNKKTSLFRKCLLFLLYFLCSENIFKWNGSNRFVYSSMHVNKNIHTSLNIFKYEIHIMCMKAIFLFIKQIWFYFINLLEICLRTVILTFKWMNRISSCS